MRLQLLAGLAAALGLSLCPSANASAQVGLAARASTLGAGVELSYRPSRIFGVRIAGNFFEFSRDATIENINYHITPHLENGTAIIDLYPVGGSFHLSGGLLLNRNQGRLVARLNQSVQIGDRTYAPDEIGSLRGTVNFPQSAPYLGLGLGGRGRIAVLFDLGVGVTGTPKVDLVGETPLTGAAKAEFDANVARELGDVRAEIDGKSYLKFHPVVSLGLRFGF